MTLFAPSHFIAITPVLHALAERPPALVKEESPAVNAFFATTAASLVAAPVADAHDVIAFVNDFVNDVCTIAAGTNAAGPIAAGIVE